MRIILATDGRDRSAGAVRLAASLAESPDSQASVLHVLEPVLAQGPPNAHVLVSPEPQFEEERKAAAVARLRDRLRGFSETVAEWAVEVKIGKAAPTIVRTAETAEATLIVLGTGRHDRAERWFGTETALRVTQLSHIPVLAAPESAGERPRVILAAVDFSAFCRDAVLQAIAVSEPDAELHLAHVLWQRPADLDILDESTAARFRDRMREHLEAWAGELEGVSRSRLTLHFLDGDAAEELLKLADRIGAELIAAGSHGIGFFGRLLLGSVSTRLLRGARCSVLISPPRERARELEVAETPAAASHSYVR
jgi:nucleotide-binding universal stress UspA family protein